MVETPYEDLQLQSGIKIRRFALDKLMPTDLVWHRDKELRKVKVLFGENWQFQFEDQLPVSISKDTEFKVPAMVYHRLLLGTTDLIVKLTG